MTLKDKILALMQSGIIEVEFIKGAKVLVKKGGNWIEGEFVEMTDDGYYRIDLGDVLYETKNVIPKLTTEFLTTIVSSILSELDNLKVGYIKAVDLNSTQTEVILTINQQPVQRIFNSEFSSLAYVIDMLYELITQHARNVQ